MSPLTTEPNDGGGFEWRLYSPNELIDLSKSAGFRVLLSCAWFDESMLPAAEYAQMQFVLERAA